MKEMYKRYGKFRIADYMASWMVICLMLIFVVACLVLKLSAAYIIVPLLYAVVIMHSILNPNRELFEITDDAIIIKKGKKEKQIKIPNELSLIISPVDICPPLSARTAVGNGTHILKGKYAVSVLMKMDMDEMVKKVHRGYIKQYTTSTIKNNFEEYNFFYSFVCNDVLLNEISRNRNVNLLVPKSMVDKISLGKQVPEMHIDFDC